MHVFATLRLLRGLLESILAPLRPIWSQKGTPKLVQKCSKKCPKTGPKNDPKNNQQIANFGPQHWIKNKPKNLGRAMGKFIRKLSWKLLVPRCPKMAQDTPKIAQEGPKMLQDGPKTAPRWPKMASSCPRWPQTGPKGFHNRPKMGDMGQDGSKMGPTRLQNCFPLLFLFLSLSFPFLCFPFLSFALLSFPFPSKGGAPQSYMFLGCLYSLDNQFIAA